MKTYLFLISISILGLSFCEKDFATGGKDGHNKENISELSSKMKNQVSPEKLDENLEKKLARFLFLKKEDNPASRHWNSELHQIMSEFGTKFGKSGYTEKALITLMGEPDVTPSLPEYKFLYLLVEKNLPLGVDHIQIYLWRGSHDFLYFVIDKQGKIIGSNWWMAFE